MTKNIKKALIIDDEPDLCELAEITLSRMGLETRSAHDIATAKALLDTESFDLCLTDMNLPDGDGIELVTYIQKNYPGIPVAVITAYGNMQLAIKALKAGAFDFVSKPVDLQIFRNLVTSAIKLPKTSQHNSDTRAAETPGASPHTPTGKYNILGNSPAIQDLQKKISKLARSQAPIFIIGESGSGKELAAHLIHEQGARASNPFIPVNCGAIPSELMESEFFGHKKGSFTGASNDKDGLFKAADGGTLFLDEVADLPLQMQVKLLRAIQEKAIRSIGDHQEQQIDVRILSASHKNLAELVKQGKFREDLYYRINVIELQIPSLRERAEDIPLLADFLLARLIAKSGLQDTPVFSKPAALALCQHNFPGNVRELENILERALALAESNIIELEDLQLPTDTEHDLKAIEEANSPAQKTDIEPVLESARATGSGTLIEQEEDKILITLEQTRWNKTAAAKLLGITLRQLRYRMQKFKIE